MPDHLVGSPGSPAFFLFIFLEEIGEDWIWGRGNLKIETGGWVEGETVIRMRYLRGELNKTGQSLIAQ